MRSSSRWSFLVGVPAILILTVGAYLGWAGRDERAAWDRISRAIIEGRPTMGRLADWTHSSYSPPGTASRAVSEARRIVQRISPESEERARLDVYIGITSGNWLTAAARLEDLVALHPEDAGLINDLGVVYLELGAGEASYLPAAFSQFERALAVDPEATAPHFNRVLIYDLLHLEDGRRAAEVAYRAVDMERQGPWMAELDRRTETGPDVDVEDALLTGEAGRAERIVEESPDAFWRFLQTHALDLTEGAGWEPALLLELADALERTTGDPTPRMIIDPLLGPDAASIVLLRRRIFEAQMAYATGGAPQVQAILDQARPLVAAVDSEFDALWFDVNQAEALAWSGDIRGAGRLLDEVIEQASRSDLKWVLADALTRFSSQQDLATRVQILQRLIEAVRIYDEIGADTASVRPRLFLAAYYQLEGSHQLSFEAAQRALDLTQPADHIGRTNLFSILSRNLLAEGALQFAYLTEAAAHAAAADSPAHVLEAQSRLAEFHARAEDPRQADLHLELSAEAIERLAGPTRDFLGLLRLLTTGRVMAMRSAYDNARSALEEGLEILPESPTRYGSAYRLELATLLVELGRDDEASEQFRRGLDAIEREDDLLGPQSRLAFDEERRRYYEAAIAFEHSRGDVRAAWLTTQRYRNKLWSDAFDRTRTAPNPRSAAFVASQIPKGGAIVEFTLLPDQILIWCLTPEGLEVKSSPVIRSELDEQIARMVRMVRDREETESLDQVSRSLYRTLIEPVDDLLTELEWIALVPDRTLHHLPFAALKDPDGRYLTESASLFQTPDVDFLFSVSDASSTANQVVFGSRARDRGIRAEIEGLGRIYPDRRLFDAFDVSRDAFLDNMAGTDLFIYAGHSAVDGGNSLSSVVQLDGVSDGENVVTALEIADQTMAPNALVVLSSCDSSVGNNIGGIEFRGLTSAFLVAGAGAVVGSLWPVDSLETAELMLDFHERVSEGTGIATALRESQARMIRDGKHPFYWAAFTVTGNRTAAEPAQFIDAA